MKNRILAGCFGLIVMAPTSAMSDVEGCERNFLISNWTAAYDDCSAAAKTGDASSQGMLATLYVAGDGVAQNLVAAYVWSTVGMVNGEELVSEFLKIRLIGLMSESERQLAGLLAQQCLASEYSECYSEDVEDEGLFENLSSASDKGWALSERRDSFTNADTSIAYLISDKFHNSNIRSSHPTRLLVGCMEDGKVQIAVMFAGYIGSGRVAVRYKFDDNDSITERWIASSEGTAAILPDNFRDFRAGLQVSDTVIFEVTDFRGTRYEARFEGLQNSKENFDFTFNGCQER